MRSFVVLTTILAAGPVLAHEGAHVHPHGIDGAWAFLAGTLVGAAGILAVIRARK